jgi:hypothetical protein
MVSVDDVRSLFRYDPNTGNLYWIKNRIGCNIGKPAGCLSRDYVVIRIDGILYQSHRLIWLHQTGEWPVEVDHINGNPSDNRWANLREVNRSQQMMNAARATGKTGVRGVTFDCSRNKYFAQINVNGRHYNLGRFDSLIEAVEVRKNAEKRLHGEYALANRQGG